MPGLWSTLDLDGRALSGTGGFRLMPDEELHHLPATGSAQVLAGGHALVVRYVWEHREDGPAEGVMLVTAGPADGPEVECTWTDAWHQQPRALHLTGSRDGGSVELAAFYQDDWGWQIRLDFPGEGGIDITMRHEVPASHGGTGPYDVMDVRLR